MVAEALGLAALYDACPVYPDAPVSDIAGLDRHRRTWPQPGCEFHATVSWMPHDHTGNLLDVGRRHRRATPALRRAVRERDKGRCQFPGCNSRRTDIHHIVPWSKGGKTRLRGLISLCEAHHVDADITTETIIPDGLADKLDLDLAICAAFANARIDREASQHNHDQDPELDLAA